MCDACAFGLIPTADGTYRNCISGVTPNYFFDQANYMLVACDPACPCGCSKSASNCTIEYSCLIGSDLQCMYPNGSIASL